jgi:nitroreductase
MAATDRQSRLTSGGQQAVAAADMIEALIMARRSVRRYAPQPVPDGWIEAVLRCGIQAPSPSNSQPVRFVRIVSETLRDALRQGLADGHAHLLACNQDKGTGARMRNRINAYRRYAEFMLDAPVLIGVGAAVGSISFSRALKDAGLISRDLRRDTDTDITIGLALKGMLLKAQALGLGGCILTAPLVFIKDVNKILGLADLQIKCFLTLGFAAESPSPTPRLPLEAVYQVL